MKSGVLWVYCRGLALVDFGRDPLSSDSWRARRNFLSGKQRAISHRPNSFKKFQHNTSIGVAMKTFATLGNDYRSPEIHYQITSYGISSFNFTVRINLKSSPGLYTTYKNLTKLSATSEYAGLLHADNAQSQAANHHWLLNHVKPGLIKCRR